MKNLKKVLSVVAVAAALATPLAADAWWGPWNNNNNGWGNNNNNWGNNGWGDGMGDFLGDGNFGFNMSGNTNARGRGYGNGSGDYYGRNNYYNGYNGQVMVMVLQVMVMVLQVMLLKQRRHQHLLSSCDV
jgi:hypothetical protein